MILHLLKKFKLRLVWLLLKVRIKRVIFWYLWNQCDAYNGSKFLSRANFILCANLSKWLTGRTDWLDSSDCRGLRLFKGGI